MYVSEKGGGGVGKVRAPHDCFLSYSDIVGFDGLTRHMAPHDVIRVVDQFHAIIDEAFSDKELFVVERTYHSCTVASGLTEHYEAPPKRHSITSMSDSSYGSEPDLQLDRNHTHSKDEPAAKSPAHHASLLATGVLKLLSSSTKVQIPTAPAVQPHPRATPITLLHTRDTPTTQPLVATPTSQSRVATPTTQLQLRAAVHSGPCSAGVVDLTLTNRTSHMPHFKLFGPTLAFARNLCSTGLSLQIRVSKQCHELLLKVGGFAFERCPDYKTRMNQKTVESYWLVERVGLALPLPSLEKALPLSEYEDVVEG